VAVEGSESRLYGTSIFVHEGNACCLEYLIECDAQGETVKAEVVGEVGDDIVEIDISVDDGHVWTMNDQIVAGVTSAIDIDLNFSPVTNILPIRRLKLAVGESKPVIAAWLRFPSFHLERFEQTYTRTNKNTYRYSSSDGAFQRDLTVDDEGIVLDYPGIWIREEG
jgi:hypothetical protein